MLVQYQDKVLVLFLPLLVIFTQWLPGAGRLVIVAHPPFAMAQKQHFPDILKSRL